MKIVTKSGTVYENITEITVEKSPSGTTDRLVFASNWLNPSEVASITDTDSTIEKWMEKHFSNDELVKSNVHLKACLDAAIARNEQLRRDLAEVQRRNTCLSNNLSGINEKVMALEVENAKLKSSKPLTQDELQLAYNSALLENDALQRRNIELTIRLDDLRKEMRDAKPSYTQRFEITVKPV